jgi:hypothetical protein
MCAYTETMCTRHEDSVFVDSDDKYDVDVFVLQVSSNTGYHFCSITKVNTNYPKYILGNF